MKRVASSFCLDLVGTTLRTRYVGKGQKNNPFLRKDANLLPVKGGMLCSANEVSNAFLRACYLQERH